VLFDMPMTCIGLAFLAGSRLSLWIDRRHIARLKQLNLAESARLQRQIERLREDLDLQRKIDLQLITEKRRLRAALERIAMDEPGAVCTVGCNDIAREALQITQENPA
jgi:hypothetical protein